MNRTVSALCRSCLGFLLLFGWSSWLFAKPFDDTAYSLSGSFHTPMSTIAGLTSWAQDINHVYGLTTWILVFVFLAVAIPLVVAIRKFRVREEDLAHLPPPKQVHGSAVLEFAWTVIPAVLLILIAVPTWEMIFKQPRHAPEGALEIEVIGHQWWWEFRYPSLGITTANELHLPENIPVYFNLSSADVIHSFWVPTWGGKVDVLPGVKNHLLIQTPTLETARQFKSVSWEQGPGHADGSQGVFFQGQCVELCGASHALMRFEAVLHSEHDFQTWVKAYNSPPVVQTALEKKGELVFGQCVSCHTISATPSADLAKQMAEQNPPAYKIGPDLTNFGSRRMLGAGTRLNTFENFAAWVRDPQAMKPEAKMTKLPLSDEDIRALAAYLRYSTVKDLAQRSSSKAHTAPLSE